jgi:hypothetical protein
MFSSTRKSMKRRPSSSPTGRSSENGVSGKQRAARDLLDALVRALVASVYP